ncbi:three-helix bundle dimerization domain-containing protein [Cellulomonas sp. McL0617]|uniref:three-helix bundle dimerization domain-containing protein n=1 Tax=Cellulomonas sp. McL0617 TaxID=3415675 RepID=UPI003CF533F0
MAIEDEHRAIDDVVDRIATRYPSLSRALVRDQVDVGLAAFDGSAVRSFVPILVERDAVEFLAEFAEGG